MISLNKNQKLIIIGIVVTVIFVIFFYIFQKIQNSKYYADVQNLEIIEENIIEVNPVTVQEDDIVVHIAGCVNNPGIIKTKEGSRISDIISLAGGLTEDSDITGVNLAYKIEDGQKIYIPSIIDKDIIEHYIISDAGEDIVTGRGSSGNSRNNDC